jgi:hypothetical protein
VPAIDRGAALPPQSGVVPIVGSQRRAELFAEAIEKL